MPYKKNKKIDNLIAQFKINIKSEKYYFHMYLWENKESMMLNAPDDVKGSDSEAMAALATSIIKIHSDGTESDEIIYPKLGEIHFIKDRWDMNIVAHELMHIMIHKIRMVGPEFEKIIYQDENAEEETCYLFGDWVSEVYLKLWEVNPSMKWCKAL